MPASPAGGQDARKRAEALLCHLPTWMLIIGYPVYWLELSFHKGNYGVTTPAAWVLFLGLCIYAVWLKVRDGSALKGFFAAVRPLTPFEKFLIWTGIVLAGLFLFVTAYASYFPPHLIQEDDALNYHYAFPRQHLIRNAFKYIPWGTYDVMPFPVQFGLAPYWFASELPNKWPQFIFLLGLLLVSARLAGHFYPKSFAGSALVVFGILGAHHVGIQSGTAMLDLVIAYLLLAALDSFLRGNVVLAAVEFTFHFWSKAFIPIQITVIAVAMVLVVWGLRKFGSQWTLGFSPDREAWQEVVKKQSIKFFAAFLGLSIIIGGPFVLRSLYCTGSPLCPFFLHDERDVPPFWKDRDPAEWHNFRVAKEMDLSMRDAYGLPKTLFNFVKHLWLAAVPEKDVNNRFDYPIGLVYLLCLGPFLWLWLRSLMEKRIALIPLFIILFWASWWFGSQQTRFLYVPLLLIYILVLSKFSKSWVLLSAVILALAFNCLSVVRAHKADWGKPRIEVVRPDDAAMVELSRSYVTAGRRDKVTLETSEITFARFPAFVAKEQFPFIIKVERR